MIYDSIARIQQRIADACTRTGRQPSEVTLVAVSKTFPEDAIRQAVHAGVVDFGENYVQELLEKRSQIADESIRWHFIGHLQSNKVKSIAKWIHLIHSVDGIGTAREIDRQAALHGRVVDVLVEINTTQEASKFGLPPEQAPDFVLALAGLEHIRILGLMTIGPFLPDAEDSRPMFQRLRRLKEDISRRHQRNVEMRHLSMGMTGDFEVAIEEGATLLRIGTAIFGFRNKQS